MRSLALIVGLAMAVLVGFCCGYEYRKVKPKSLSRPRGYTLIESGKAVNHLGDTVLGDFRAIHKTLTQH